MNEFIKNRSFEGKEKVIKSIKNKYLNGRQKGE